MIVSPEGKGEQEWGGEEETGGGEDKGGEGTVRWTEGKGGEKGKDLLSGRLSDRADGMLLTYLFKHGIRIHFDRFIVGGI